jgi:hypothetical protein
MLSIGKKPPSYTAQPRSKLFVSVFQREKAPDRGPFLFYNYE